MSTTLSFPAIVKYEGIAENDIEDEEYPASTYIAIKKQPFYTTIAAHDRPGFFANCSTKITLNYYDVNSHSVTHDLVTFVSTFPIEYKTRVSLNGTEMEVEAIIYSLSSQHQGALFSVVIEVVERVSQYKHVIATVPFKVVSKTDSLSTTVPTPEGRRKTITELLGTALNKVELAEIQNTKMLHTLCKINGIYDPQPISPERSANLEMLVKRLCQEYRGVVKAQRAHRLFCSVAGLMDDELELLSKVNEAFSDSFQKAFDINYELLCTNKIKI